MTSKERVRCTLECREPDRVPIFDFLNSRPLFEEVLGRPLESRTAEDIVECSSRIGYDLAVVAFGLKKGLRKRGTRYEDEWGTVFEKSERNWPVDAPVGFTIRNREDLKNFHWPDPDDPSRLTGIKTAVCLGREKDIFIVGAVRGPFSSSWLVNGFENMMINLYDDPDFVEEIVAGCTAFYTRGAELMIESGVDAVIFTDDYGSNIGPFISTPIFRERFLPHISKMVKKLRDTGVPVIMHSDGNIAPLLADLVKTGIAAYHPVERSAGMDLGVLKKEFGGLLPLIGNVNNKTTLIFGTAEDVENEVKECIQSAAPGGGYILASDHSLHSDVPNENVFALYDAGRRYGKYPIAL